MATDHYRSMFSLDDRVAVVTGACGLLGKRFTAALAEFGARVVSVDLDAVAVDEWSKELADRYECATLGVPCDISDPLAVRRMLSDISAFGPPRILVNNAATKTDDLSAFLAPVEAYDIEVWRRVNAVNLDGAFLVAQAIGQAMANHGLGGSIVQIASIYGVMGPDNRIYAGSSYNGQPISTPPVYAASKAGLIGLSRYLATTWAEKGIRVNTLIPGGIESGQNLDFVDLYSARVPLQRMAKPDEMAGALLFLASDASSYVTGQDIAVDGGLSAW